VIPFPPCVRSRAHNGTQWKGEKRWSHVKAISIPDSRRKFQEEIASRNPRGPLLRFKQVAVCARRDKF